MMNKDSSLHSSTAMIYQSLAELHTLLSALEEQTKLGLFPAQPQPETVEVITSEDSSPATEDGILADWL